MLLPCPAWAHLGSDLGGGFELVAFSLERTHSSLEKVLSSWWRSSAGFYFSCLLVRYDMAGYKQKPTPLKHPILEQ